MSRRHARRLARDSVSCFAASSSARTRALILSRRSSLSGLARGLSARREAALEIRRASERDPDVAVLQSATANEQQRQQALKSMGEAAAAIDPRMTAEQFSKVFAKFPIFLICALLKVD